MHGENLRTRVVTQVENSRNLSGNRALGNYAVFVQEKEMPQSQSDDEHVVEVTKTEILKARPKRSQGIPRDPKTNRRDSLMFE